MGGSPERRTVVILLALIVAGGLVAAIAVVLLRPASQDTSEPAAITYDAPTAKEVYPLALEVAREWASDAQLASVAGAWTQPVDTTLLNAGRTSWSFYFYSETRAELATIVTTQDSARFVAGTPFQAEVVLLSDVGWQVDSDDAIRIVMDNGGREFMSGRGDAAVNLRLSTAASHGRVLWTGSILSGTDQNLSSFVVEVDATSGEVRNVQVD